MAVCSGSLIPTVNLGPVETDQLPGTFGEEKAVRVVPLLALTQDEIRTGPRALLGVLGECPPVEGDPGVLVLAGHERPDRHPVRIPGLLQARPQRTPHLPERPDPLEARGPGQPA